MQTTAAEIIANAAALIGRTGGVRSECSEMLSSFFAYLDLEYAFICTERTDSDQFDVIASVGIDAATFRRLGERGGRSALLRAIGGSEQVEILVNDEPTLDFLFREGRSVELLCRPVTNLTTTIGFAAFAFDKGRMRRNAEMLYMLESLASLTSLAIGVSAVNAKSLDEVENTAKAQKSELREMFGIRNVIGNSGPMRHVKDLTTQIARSNATVLLRGETGTGKELLASAIHFSSLRSKRAFVKIDCSSRTDHSLENEIFGAVFDGTTVQGKIDQADGGTLFLNGVSDLPTDLQIKLQRLLAEREFERQGEKSAKAANVRVIAATSKDIEAEVLDGGFRDELFHLISAYSIHIPPLRERRSDILLLAEHFVSIYAARLDKPVKRISTPAIDMLMAYHFPGNVRELENVIERAVLVCEGGVVHGHHLPPTLQTAEHSGTVTRLSLDTAVAGFEKDMIQDALKSTRGNIAKAARLLNSTERILGYKIKNYEIDPRRFRI